MPTFSVDDVVAHRWRPAGAPRLHRRVRRHPGRPCRRATTGRGSVLVVLCGQRRQDAPALLGDVTRAPLSTSFLHVVVDDMAPARSARRCSCAAEELVADRAEAVPGARLLDVEEGAFFSRVSGVRSCSGVMSPIHTARPYVPITNRFSVADESLIRGTRLSEDSPSAAPNSRRRRSPRAPPDRYRRSAGCGSSESWTTTLTDPFGRCAPDRVRSCRCPWS